MELTTYLLAHKEININMITYLTKVNIIHTIS